LIANGAYVAVGTIDGIGDAGQMLQHGSPRWLLVAWGATAAAAGLWLWHRTSGEFGFGRTPRRIEWREAGVVAILATTLISFGFLFDAC
jgi:hypothetical protein